MWKFLWELAKDSFHGAFRVLEIGEASAATVLYAAGYFFPGVEKELKTASVAILIIFLWTFLIGLFLAAYRRDQEKGQERDRLADEFEAENAKLRALVESVEQRQAALQQQYQNPKKLTRLSALRDFIEQAEAFQRWALEPADSELFGRMIEGLPSWDERVKDFLTAEHPAGLETYVDLHGLPVPDNRASTQAFFGRKLEALRKIRTAIQSAG